MSLNWECAFSQLGTRGQITLTRSATGLVDCSQSYGRSILVVVAEHVEVQGRAHACTGFAVDLQECCTLSSAVIG